MNLRISFLEKSSTHVELRSSLQLMITAWRHVVEYIREAQVLPPYGLVRASDVSIASAVTPTSVELAIGLCVAGCGADRDHTIATPAPRRGPRARPQAHPARPATMSAAGRSLGATKPSDATACRRGP